MTMLDRAIEELKADGYRLYTTGSGQISRRRGSNCRWYIDRCLADHPGCYDIQIAVGAKRRCKTEGHRFAIMWK